MRNRSRSQIDWETPAGSNFTWDHVQVEVLMDIRDELRQLNALLACPNFQAIPRTLVGIRRNTAKPKPKAKR